MTLKQRFDPDALIALACERAGSDDFGDEGWRPGLERVADGLVNEARLSPIGVEIAHLDLLRALTNRLGVIAWRKDHPEIAAKPITSPIFIVGQPRTGTTILYDLLAQDPDLRAPLTWEVDAPCPVPQPETYHIDPRIAQAQASIEMSEQIVPGFLTFHPMGALVGQECVRITASEFTSMIFSVQYRLPSYSRWLLYDADHTGAYRFHRIFLQHLQSGVAGQWLLKSPAHLWQLDKLIAEYPDALIVQTHRDPLNVISSIAALTHHLRRMGSDESNIAECAAQSYEEIVVGLERAMACATARPWPPTGWSTFSSPISCKTRGPRSAGSITNWADNCVRRPSRRCATFSPHTPAMAAAAATPGRTPAWTRQKCASGCVPTSSATTCRPKSCAKR